MSKTFEICSVREKLSSWRESTSIKSAIDARFKSVIGCSEPDMSILDLNDTHSLIAAAHVAFDEHRELILSPDVIWVTIAQGFARHISLHAEEYRGKFVHHEGKKRLEFWSDFLPGTPELPWNNVLGEFSTLVKKEIGEETHKLIVSDFSTTGIVERAVSEAVLLDSMQSYFEYYGGTMCGIPRITLEGTPEDWEKLNAKVKALAAFGGLDWWLGKVSVITQQCVDAANYKVDLDFWNSLFKIKSISGGPYISGWIMHLLPYTYDLESAGKDKENAKVEMQNPILSMTEADARHDSWSGGGIKFEVVPKSVSNVPFIWNYMGTEVNHEFVAGTVGVSVAENRAVKPVLGWAVRKL